MVGQHHVKLVQDQIRQQIGHLSVVAHQAQVGHTQHRPQQTPHFELGQPVGNAHCQPRRGRLDGGKHLLGQGLGELEDLLCLLQGHHAGFGQGQSSSCGAQQLAAEVALELAHLSAHGLYRHVQSLGSARHAALLGHDPEVIQMPVVEAQAHIQILMESDSLIFFFFRCIWGLMLHARTKAVQFLLIPGYRHA